MTLLGAVVLVTVEDWRVGLGMAVFVAAVVGLVARLRDRAVPAAAAERGAYADVIGLVEEQLAGVEDLRALGGGGLALERHERASAHHARALRRAWRASAGVYGATTGAFAYGGVGMLAGGWLLHRQGAITIGTVFLLFQYVQILRRPVEVMAEQLEQVQRAGAGASRLGALLAERPALDVQGDAGLPDGPLRRRGVRLPRRRPGGARRR